jgi:hypothetical protein
MASLPTLIWYGAGLIAIAIILTQTSLIQDLLNFHPTGYYDERGWYN